MNISLADLYKKIKAFFAKKRGISVDVIRDPAGDWGKIVIVFSILAIFALAVDTYFFYKVNSGEYVSENRGATPVEIVERSSLQKVINIYTEKHAAFEMLRRSKPAVVDPSLQR